MNLSLSPSLRRAFALLILIALIGLIWSAAVRPLVGLWEARRTDIAELSGRLAHLEAVAARRPQLEQRLRNREAELAAAGGMWRGASATAIAAAVQDRLTSAVAASGGKVNSSSPGPETMEHGFRRVPIHFTIEGTLDTLTKTLAAVEAAQPALFADGITVAVPDNTAANGPPTLRFDLDVSGYLAEHG